MPRLAFAPDRRSSKYTSVFRLFRPLATFSRNLLNWPDDVRKPGSILHRKSRGDGGEPDLPSHSSHCAMSMNGILGYAAMSSIASSSMCAHRFI